MKDERNLYGDFVLGLLEEVLYLASEVLRSKIDVTSVLVMVVSDQAGILCVCDGFSRNNFVYERTETLEEIVQGHIEKGALKPEMSLDDLCEFGNDFVSVWAHSYLDQVGRNILAGRILSQSKETLGGEAKSLDGEDLGPSVA